MANFKRGRCKNSRSGCLLCHPNKANGVKGRLSAQTRQEQKARVSEREQLALAYPGLRVVSSRSCPQ